MTLLNNKHVKKYYQICLRIHFSRREGEMFSLLSYILLIREAKTLDPFLRKLRGCRSMKFGKVIHYKEE